MNITEDIWGNKIDCLDCVYTFKDFKLAVEYDRLDEFKQLLQAIKDLRHSRILRGHTHEDWWNIIHYIAASGQKEYFDCLIDFDIGLVKNLLNEKNEDNQTPDMLAYYNHNYELSKLMTELAN